MKPWRTGMILLSVILLAACPRNGDREVTPDTTAAVAPHRDPGAVPEAAQTVPLTPAPGESVRAEAVIVPVGVQTQVTVHIHDAPPNTSLTAHLLTGSCEQPGPLAADLQPVTTDAAGQGTSQIAVDVPPAIVINGNHLVQLRRSNGRDGLPVACGAVPSHPVLPGQTGTE